MDFSISFDVYAISNHNDWVNLHPIKIITFIFPFHRYGNLVPSTKWGKIVTMLYAVCGIPVYFIYFMNMGKVRKYLEITFDPPSSSIGLGKYLQMALQKSLLLCCLP